MTDPTPPIPQPEIPPMDPVSPPPEIDPAGTPEEVPQRPGEAGDGVDWPGAI